jgi:hypothetical protein
VFLSIGVVLGRGFDGNCVFWVFVVFNVLGWVELIPEFGCGKAENFSQCGPFVD